MTDVYNIQPFTVNIRYRPGKTKGILVVGQCKEFPFIIVQGNSIKDIKEKIAKELQIFYRTFPDKCKDMIKRIKDGRQQQSLNLPDMVVDGHNDNWINEQITIQLLDIIPSQQ